MTGFQHSKQARVQGPSTARRPGRLSRSLASSVAVVFCTTLLACGSGGESGGSDAPAAAVFAVDGVSVGIGFDEPVRIEGESASGPLVESTEVDLERGDDAPFVRSVSARDEAGNATSVRVEVEIRDAGAS